VFEDGLLLSFLRENRAIARSFNKAESRARRVVAWDDKVLEMQAKKLRSKNGLLWGEPEVLVWLKWKCTGVPTAVKKKHD
jgi:hypothetical protein